MAPRPLETRDEFIRRLQATAADAASRPIGVGAHHHTHAVVLDEDGVWRIRRLHLDRARADAYLAEHGMFMPEHAEMLSEPGPEVVLAADSLDGLIAGLHGLPWPLR